MNTDGLCSKCPIDTYINVTGSKECLKCPDRTITLAEGSTECKTRKFIIMLFYLYKYIIYNLLISYYIKSCSTLQKCLMPWKGLGDISRTNY